MEGCDDMGRAKQPIQLLKIKGNKHLTKAEIAEREATEIRAPDDNIVAPNYLNKKQTDTFYTIANELKRIDIMSNIDVDVLARYVIAESLYLKLTRKINSKSVQDDIISFEKYVNMQDKYFKQCQACAKELGLTISSRCKLVVPKKDDKPKENKFSKFKAGVVNG